ncbi:MAG: hypothetical protein KBF88_10350, partial [Polyangiaceae bacterium]|nr:hypothetical protein [Polyangiaceae bacterium]
FRQLFRPLEPQACPDKMAAVLTNYDLPAYLLLGVAVIAFFLGNNAVANTEDFRAIYLFGVGGTCLWGAVQIARSGVRQ